MKIGRKRHSRNRNLVWLALLILVFSVGLFLGERGLLRSLDNAVPAGLPFDGNGGNGRLPVLAVDMPFANYNRILAQREAARAAGVIVTTEADFVPATIRSPNGSLPIRLRLQQGTAAHLGDNEKWSFEVQMRDGHRLLNIQHFYLLDPAANNWLNEWAFAQSLRREGILAPRYHFVHFLFNGNDWGIYAVQEAAGQDLIASQNRPEGVIVEFDTARWWQSLAHFEGNVHAAMADPVIALAAPALQNFEIGLAAGAVNGDDDWALAQAETAIGRMGAWQRGQLDSAAVFDVARYGRFLALVDLWGAIGATSPVNLRLYYNAQSGLLEPVGYNGNPLSSEARISPDSLYHDLAFQTAYIEAASRLSQPGYLQELQAELGAELQQLQTMLGVEVDLDLPWQELDERQEQMRRSLNPVQPVLARLSAPEPAILPVIQVDVANALNLPLEIVGFDVGGAAFLDVDPAWIQGDATNWLVGDDAGRVILRARDGRRQAGYVRFHLPLAIIQEVTDELDDTQAIEILVAARLVGRDGLQLTPARQDYLALPEGRDLAAP